MMMTLQIVSTLIAIGILIVLVLENRNPAKTMAWMLVLIFLPIVGLVIYFFFGRTHRRDRLINTHSVSEITKRSMLGFVSQPRCEYPQKYGSLIRFLKNSNGALPYDCNKFKIFITGSDMLDSLLHEIAYAKSHIHIQFYIFQDDAVGRLVRDFLIWKASEGVEIRLIYDDVGCWSVRHSFFREMKEKGVDARSFLKVLFPGFTGRVNYRNHRKIVVIDGKVGFIGGMNIATRYVRGSKIGDWRDTHVRIEGRGVYGLQRAFLLDWYFVSRELIDDKKYYHTFSMEESEKNGNSIVQVVTADPIGMRSDIMHGLVMAISRAERYFYIQTPYFLPTEPIIAALKIAARSGVDVRVMIPLHSDSVLPYWATCSYLDDMMKSGVRIYQYKMGFLHSKMMVSDDWFSTIGSTNMDFRSFENNFEVNAFVYDHATALNMKHIFVEDMKLCNQLNLRSWRRRGLSRKVRESFVRILSPLL